MDDFDPSRRSVLTTLAALPAAGKWIWQGPIRPADATFSAAEVTYDSGRASTAELLAGATTRDDWGARLARRLGPSTLR